MNRTKKAYILGSGISAWSSVAILAKDGWELEVIGSSPILPPYMTVSDSTLALLSALPGDGLFCRFHGNRVESLRVHWGQDYYELDEPIWIVDAERFHQSWSQLVRNSAGDAVSETNQGIGSVTGVQTTLDSADSTYWVVNTRGIDTRATVDDDHYRFGKRTTVSALCELKPNACRRTAIMEATRAGWVYMAPTGDGTALIQAVLTVDVGELEPSFQLLMDGSQEVKNHVGKCVGRLHASSAAPYLAGRLFDLRSVAVGPAAFGVDPISGDCAGLDIKSAILGAALMQAVENGEDPAKCVDYYRFRLRAHLLEHLKACSTLYEPQVFSSAWDSEIEATRDGIEWLETILRRQPDLRIQLHGKHLERR